MLSEARLMKNIAASIIKINFLEGVPIMHWFGIAGEYNCMVMELLGQNLEELYNFCSRHFSLKTILLIGIEMVLKCSNNLKD